VTQLQRHAVGHRNAHVAERLDLARVVGHQLERGDAQVLQHRQADRVVAHVGTEAQALVGFHGIGATVLQLVGADLVEQADTTAFLTQVQQHAAAFLGDGTQGTLELEATIAAQAEQRVTGQALGMQAPQHRLTVGDVAEGQRDMLLARGLFEKAMHGEHTERRRCRRSARHAPCPWPLRESHAW